MFRIIVRFRGCRICWNCIIQVSSHTPNKIWQIMFWETGTRLRLWPLAFGSLQIANMSHIIAVDGRNQCWFQLRFTPSHPKYYRPSEKKKLKYYNIYDVLMYWSSNIIQYILNKQAFAHLLIWKWKLAIQIAPNGSSQAQHVLCPAFWLVLPLMDKILHHKGWWLSHYL